MELSEEIRRILDRAAIQWDKTEALLKLAENTVGEAIISAVFELRYAGRRLVDLVRVALANDLTKKDDLLAYVVEVEQFCFRAQHDAIDGIVGHLNARLRFMEKEFGVSLLFEQFTHYPATNAKLDELAKVVVESRGQRGKRAEIYDRIQKTDLPELIEKIKELDRSEKALIALAQKQKALEDDRIRQIQLGTSLLRWTIGGVIVALIVGAVALAVAIFKN